MKKRIIYFTKYTSKGPSSRYRSYNYFSYFKQAGYEIELSPLFPSKYLDIFFKKGKKSLYYIVKGYCNRLYNLLILKKYDVIVIEYELFPFLPYFIEWLFLKGSKNIVIDYDDAIFHNYDKSNHFIIKLLCRNKIYKLVRLANTVITGSPYLTETLEKYNQKIIEIPTSIEFYKYQLIKHKTELDTNKPFKVGWIGSKTQSINIAIVTEALKNLQKKYKIQLVLIGFDHFLEHILSGINYKLIEWKAETENEVLQSLDVGIMPLKPSYFNLGKCGFKLIQYMASGLPTISTPLEANVKINRDGNNLFAANIDEWEQCFEEIINNKDYFKNEVGKKNLEIAKNYYSTEVNYKKYLSVFESILG